MKSKYKYLLLIIVTIVTSVMIYNYVEASKPVPTESDILYNQNQIENNLLSNTNYTINEPNVVLNPYELSPLTAVVIFQTKDLATATVTIKGKDDDTDITTTFIPTRLHIIPVYGLYPDYDNTVIIECSGEEKILNIKTTPLPEGLVNAEKINEYDTEDLYFTTAADFNNVPVAYDKNGNIRWYLTKEYGWDFTRLNNGHILLSNYSMISKPYYSMGLVEMDLLGKIYAEYNLPGGYHHKAYELANSNLLVLSNNFESGTIEDYIVEIDRASGGIVKKIDIYELMPSNEGCNWLGLNSLFYDARTNSITLSGLKANIIINIDYTSEEINWLIGDNIPAAYQKYVLTNDGASYPNAPQSVIQINNTDIAFVNGNNEVITYRIINRTYEEVNKYALTDSSKYTTLDYVHNVGMVITQNNQIKILNNELNTILETNHNLYSTKLLSVYAGDTYVTGQGLRLGSIGATTTTRNGIVLFSKVDESITSKYNIELFKDVNRLVFMGTFKKNDKVQIILDNVLDKKTYNVQISETPYVKDDTNSQSDMINTVSYINEEGLKGKYYIYVKINGTVYKLHKYVWFY